RLCFCCTKVIMSFPFVLDEKSTVVPVSSVGEQSGGKRKVSYGDARSNSERAAPSAWVGKRLSASKMPVQVLNRCFLCQVAWVNRTCLGSTRKGRSLAFVEKIKSELGITPLHRELEQIDGTHARWANLAKLTGDNLTAKMRF